jgi:MFS family permease
MISDDLHSDSAGGTRRETESFRQCPVGLGLAISFGVLFAVTALLSPLHRDLHSTADLAVLSVLVGLTGVLLTTVTALSAAVFSAFLLNGFLIDRDGTLQWHGWVELTRLGILIAVALAGSAMGWLSTRPERQQTGDDRLGSEQVPGAVGEVRTPRVFIPYPTSVLTGTAVPQVIHRSARHD